MEIHELYGIESAAEARGHVVVIDVLRAFTCTAYALAGGARQILLAGSIDEALALKRARPGSLLIGHGTREQAPLFDVGNSPYALTQLDLHDRVLIQRTGSGTQGVVGAVRAEAVYAASLVNAAATARHLHAIGATCVSLLAMGAPRGPDGPEDVACRALLAAHLRGDAVAAARLDDVRHIVSTCPAAAELRDPAQGIGRPEDVELALDIDRFGFAIEVARRDGVLSAEPWIVTPEGVRRGVAPVTSDGR